jgi:hypothetical protein
MQSHWLGDCVVHGKIIPTRIVPLWFFMMPFQKFEIEGEASAARRGRLDKIIHLYNT